ncbi:Long-chain-fatty-acid--CoA ligase [Mycolicibacterium rhodesiae JS60]|nr:Long-chain-fatty-acid--CoA ligase [Mycolicibacterium rhodesiae JS60]
MPMTRGPAPNVADVALRPALERYAARYPDETLIRFEDGTSWTRAQGVREAYAAAHELRRAGVRQDDRVGVLLGNGPDFLRTWWGTLFLGATLVPINTAYRGNLLAHLLRLAKPRVVVSDDAGHAEIDAALAGSVDRPARLWPADIQGDAHFAAPPELERPLAIWDTAMLIMTSGTTGPSKLAVNSTLQLYLGGSWFATDRSIGRDDVYLIDLPLFHAAGLWQGTASLVTGLGIALRSAPDLRNYWEVAREAEATMGILLSTMVPFLLGQPVRAAERQHRLRTMIASPPPPNIGEFMQRFGLRDASTGYGLTEVPAPLVHAVGDVMEAGYCGRLREGFECRIVDAHDIEVPEGQPGELIVRAGHPWMITSGYVDNPEATAESWRNGWFHTGDTMRREDDRYFFVDRAKDSMRRRGENISSSELEAELSAHPDIAEAACVPHRPEGTVEDEVKAWIVAKPDAALDFEALLRWCADRMAHFMVPRYFELTDELPKTPSQRVKKYELRQRGNSENTWDREAHGFEVRRDGLREIQSRST